MVRRSTNSFALKKKRLLHRAFIKRSDPFRRVDEEELDAACRRIAGNTEFGHWSEWHNERDGDHRVIGFETVERAKEMQQWIDTSGIAKRPMPKLGPSTEELAALRDASLKWGFSTGAARRVVQAYRRKMFEAGEGAEAQYQASHAVALFKLPGDETMTIGMILVDWAKENHADWFYGRRRPASEPKAAPSPNDVKKGE